MLGFAKYAISEVSLRQALREMQERDVRFLSVVSHNLLVWYNNKPNVSYPLTEVVTAEVIQALVENTTSAFGDFTIALLKRVDELNREGEQE